MDFIFGGIRLSNHDVQLDGFIATIEDDLRLYRRRLKSTVLVKLEIVDMTAFKVAFEAFGIGL